MIGIEIETRNTWSRGKNKDKFHWNLKETELEETRKSWSTKLLWFPSSHRQVWVLIVPIRVCGVCYHLLVHILLLNHPWFSRTTFLRDLTHMLPLSKSATVLEEEGQKLRWLIEKLKVVVVDNEEDRKKNEKIALHSIGGPHADNVFNATTKIFILRNIWKLEQ